MLMNHPGNPGRFATPSTGTEPMLVTFVREPDATDDEADVETHVVGLIVFPIKQGSLTPKRVRCPVGSSISGVVSVPVAGFSK